MHRFLGLLTLALAAAAGCTAQSSPPPPPVCSAPQGGAAGAGQLASADTAFALAFFPPAASAAGASGNVIVSPYSVSTTLTMIDVGAAGETEAQLRATLHLPGSGTTLTPDYAALACTDETDGNQTGDQLSIANAVWAQQGKTFEAAFLSTLAKGYDAPVQLADFAGNAAGATSAINAWVSQQTEGNIADLLQGSDVTTATRLVLVDAVYFKGTWLNGFDPNDTQPQSFTLSDGTSVQVPTMSSTVQVGTGHASGASFYELPYEGGALAMDFVVPDKGSLTTLASSLTASDLAAGFASLQFQQVLVSLPKFAFKTRLELAPVLGAMGMTDLFDPLKADLAGVDGAQDLFIGTVVHEATVEVDESGTVATAATAGGAVAGIEEEIIIDGPFLFFIRDTKTGSLLFMGQVQDPRQD